MQGGGTGTSPGPRLSGARHTVRGTLGVGRLSGEGQ